MFIDNRNIGHFSSDELTINYIAHRTCNLEFDKKTRNLNSSKTT